MNKVSCNLQVILINCNAMSCNVAHRNKKAFGHYTCVWMMVVANAM